MTPMITTPAMIVTPFTPTKAVPPFQFRATLDGALYTVAVTWNVSGQRWYFNLYDQSANLIVCLPVIGSPDPPETGLNLIGGYFFTSKMYFYVSTQSFMVMP